MIIFSGQMIHHNVSLDNYRMILSSSYDYLVRDYGVSLSLRRSK